MPSAKHDRIVNTHMYSERTPKKYPHYYMRLAVVSAIQNERERDQMQHRRALILLKRRIRGLCSETRRVCVYVYCMHACDLRCGLRASLSTCLACVVVAHAQSELVVCVVLSSGPASACLLQWCGDGGDCGLPGASRIIQKACTWQIHMLIVISCT